MAEATPKLCGKDALRNKLIFCSVPNDALHPKGLGYSGYSQCYVKFAPKVKCILAKPGVRLGHTAVNRRCWVSYIQSSDRCNA